MKESSFVNRSSWWDGSDSYKNYDCKTVCLINAGSDCKQPVTFLTLQLTGRVTKYSGCLIYRTNDFMEDDNLTSISLKKKKI